MIRLRFLVVLSCAAAATTLGCGQIFHLDDYSVDARGDGTSPTDVGNGDEGGSDRPDTAVGQGDDARDDKDAGYDAATEGATAPECVTNAQCPTLLR